jgi:hypothetical protein
LLRAASAALQQGRWSAGAVVGGAVLDEGVDEKVDETTNGAAGLSYGLTDLTSPIPIRSTAA